MEPEIIPNAQDAKRRGKIPWPSLNQWFVLYIILFSILEIVNFQCGYALQKFHLEYMGHGSQKWREQGGFWLFLATFAIWLYPFSVFVLIASLKKHHDEAVRVFIPTRNLIITILVSAFILRLLYLGVWTGIFGAPPYEQDPLSWLHPIRIWGHP